MPDYPDFYGTNVSWSRRDWASKEAEMKSWAFEKTTDLPAGNTASGVLYTVPNGKRLYLTDLGVGGEYKGVFSYLIENGAWLFNALLNAYNTANISFSTPPVLYYGEKLKIYSENHDTVGGKWHGFFLGFETPASEPEKPKNDSPEELYRTGQFNWANIYQLDNDESLIIFGKHRDKIVNYYRVITKDFVKVKKINSFKISRESVKDIRSVLKNKPSKIKKELEYAEKQLKPRKGFFFPSPF